MCFVQSPSYVATSLRARTTGAPPNAAKTKGTISAVRFSWGSDSDCSRVGITLSQLMSAKRFYFRDFNTLRSDS